MLSLASSATAAGIDGAVPDVDGFARHLAERINDYRARHGLRPLEWSIDLVELAAEHSHDMARRRTLTHEGFSDRRRRTRSRLCVENVAHNFATPESLLDGWRRSPTHHRNVLDPGVERMGLAATARYVTFLACG